MYRVEWNGRIGAPRYCIILCFFFFSSRRRHTRSLCDWSSDVCSSDLTGANLTHIPYKGGGQAMTDALGGNVPLVYTAVAGAIPHVKAGRLVPLAVSSDKRSPSFPDGPTFMESGVPDFEADSWVAILAPAKTPRAIVDKLNRELNAVLTSPETVDRLATLGIVATPGTPEQLSAQIRVDLVKYGRVVKAANIKAE